MIHNENQRPLIAQTSFTLWCSLYVNSLLLSLLVMHACGSYNMRDGRAASLDENA